MQKTACLTGQVVNPAPVETLRVRQATALSGPRVNRAETPVRSRELGVPGVLRRSDFTVILRG